MDQHTSWRAEYLNKNVKRKYPFIIVSWEDNSVKIWRNLLISNPKPEIYNTKTHTKFGENLLTFTQISSGNENTDGRTYDRQTDGQTDGQREQ